MHSNIFILLPEDQLPAVNFLHPPQHTRIGCMPWHDLENLERTFLASFFSTQLGQDGLSVATELTAYGQHMNDRVSYKRLAEDTVLHFCHAAPFSQVSEREQAGSEPAPSAHAVQQVPW